MTSPARVRWPAQVLLLWTMLAGLFLMHGAASPGDGCMSGAPMTAMSLSAMSSAASPATPAPAKVAIRSASIRSASMRPAPAGRHVLTTARAAHDGSGMLCVTRQPGTARAGPGAVLSHAPPVPGAARAPTTFDAFSPRADRPPGRPGLPLPLFLCVSRT